MQHVYILHSLSESQSILLLADIENPEQLLSSLFSHAFDIFAGAGANGDMDISKSVEYHLKSLLCTVVEESDLPNEITDIIISQFLRVDAPKVAEHTAKKRKLAQDQKQGTLLLKDYPPAYNMAKSICTTCQEKMTSQVTSYFNTIIIDASSSANGKAKEARRRFSALEDTDDEEDEGLADLRKAHRLLKELWRACPDILINVVPQIEAELSADSIPLRQLATETLGDLAAGVGIAGLASSPPVDASSYPLPSVNQPPVAPPTTNPLLTPASPKPFASIHRTAYQNYLSRRNDTSQIVRIAWVRSAACILFTAAGGIGLGENERDELLAGFAQMLRDPDERVRIAAIKAIKMFDYHNLVTVLGADGGLAMDGSIFSTLAERFTDRKFGVREEAIALGATLWGVASADIEEGVENVTTVLGDFPNRMLNAYYTNDKHIHALLDRALYESLLPLSFPPIKASAAQSASQRRRTKDGADSSQEPSASDPDAIRARRVLTLVRGLDNRSKLVFFGMQGNQVQMSKAITLFLKACELYNGGVVDDPDEEQKVKKQLTTFVESLSRAFPEPAKASTDLWKFADMHNRRDYQLIRFAMAPDSDYRTVQKALKELNKRIREGPSTTQSLIETLNPLLYKCSLVVYNRSHVPAIMDVSRTDENGLAATAHETLREISTKNPEVLKNHIQALCQELEETAPSATKFEEASSADTLKACAHFARQYPTDVPKERKFLTALANFALYSKSPRAAKHAVSIVLTVADRKEMYAKDVLTKALKDCKHTSPNFLSRLSAISQICLLAPTAATGESDAIRKMMLAGTLQQNLSPSEEENENAWDDIIDDGTQAKVVALKALVNRCRSANEKEHEEFDQIVVPVLDILMQFITNNGKITSSQDTTPAQRNILRLTAAKLVLKLCSHKRRCEDLVTAPMFTSCALIVINPPNPVRIGFTNQLKKYLGRQKLSHRWFTVLFLLAFEPDDELRSSTLTWLRSRVQFFERQQQQSQARSEKKTHQNVMESIFARLLSLMAHHPDYPDKNDETFDAELLDFSKYIIFYLVAVATQDNLSLIFHIAQRIKQTRDNVSGEDEMSERLYVLSDLAQVVIRNYADMMPTAKGINLLQTWPGSVTLPKSLFKALPSHDVAQQIAENNYLPEDTALGLEALIKSYVKSVKGGKTLRRPTYAPKKRKTASVDLDSDGEGDAKRASKKVKVKKTTLPVRKTPKKTMSSPATEQPSRKSARASNAVKYAEADSEDDDAEMEDQVVTSSSPVAKRSEKTQQSTKAAEPPAEDGDEEMSDAEVEDQGGTGTERTNGVHVHVDDDAQDEDGDEEDEVAEGDESEGEGTPSPLKERQNTPVSSKKPASAKKDGKTKAKTTTKTPTKPAKAVKGAKASKAAAPATAARTTRATRSGKA